MSKHRSIEATRLLLFLAVVSFSVDGVCWNCMPENLSEEAIDRILAEDFKNRLMEKLGLTSEPVVPENVTYPPQEIINEIFSEENDVMHRQDSGALQTIVLQPLNNDSTVSNTTSFFEYKANMDKLNNYRIDHVTLWLHVNGNTGSYKVFEKMSTLPRRMVFMDEYHDNASKWKKMIFIHNKLWLENPGRIIRIEIEGMETPVVHKPLLQLNIKRKEKRLKKRSKTSLTATDDCHPKKKDLCCRHQRIIPISKYYKWVVVPATFRSFTCSGNCDPNHRNNNTWSLLSQVAAPSRSPCCVPTSFDTMTLLIVDNDSSPPTFESKVIKDLLVKSCGCL